MASSWFIKYTKKIKYDLNIFNAANANIWSDFLYKFFPLRKDIKDKIHNERLNERH